MYIEILLAVVLGIISGIMTGLTPGIHINLISIIVVSSSAILLRYTSPISLGCFIIALALTHTFLDAIPGIYLGAPDEAQALNVLPGHRLLLQGLGHNAVLCTVIGSLGSVLLSIILFPLFIFSMIWLQPLVAESIGYILIVIVLFMIWRQKGKRLYALLAFLLAGVLGLLVFNIASLKQPLFPLRSGLFGLSLLLVSLSAKVAIPPQRTTTS